MESDIFSRTPENPSRATSLNATISFPRSIHQTWKTRELPSFIERCVSTVKGKNPDWNHRLYEDEEMEEVIRECGEISVDDFRRIPTGIEKADVFRCAVLFCRGGAYCDVDMESIRPLDELIADAVAGGHLTEAEEIIMTTDHPIHCERLFGYDVFMNNFLLAKPGAGFLGYYLSEVASSARQGGLGGDPVHTTGPARLTRMIHSIGGAYSCQIAIVPSQWVNPLPDMTLHFQELGVYDEMIRSGRWRQELTPYLAHHWWHSYCSENSNVSRYGELLWKEV